MTVKEKIQINIRRYIFIIKYLRITNSHENIN